MKTVRILIADDHDIVRDGLRALLQPQRHWQICGEAATGRQAVELARTLKPDVIVMDFSMPELNGLEATRQIRKALPRTEVLVLTMHDSEQVARNVLAAGARGVLLKTEARHHLVPAVEALARHEPFLIGKLSQLMLDVFLHPERQAERAGEPADRLTPREREIVQLISEGLTSKEVASRLDISLRTVDTHRANVMRKLGLRAVTELVRYAIRNRIAEA